jgi:hypothetical protein
MTILLHHLTANTCAIRSEGSTCTGIVPPMHPGWIGVITDHARVGYDGRLRRARAHQRITWKVKAQG